MGHRMCQILYCSLLIVLESMSDQLHSSEWAVQGVGFTGKCPEAMSMEAWDSISYAQIRFKGNDSYLLTFWSVV